MSALGEFVVPLLQLLLLPFVAVIGVLVHVFSTFLDCARPLRRCTPAARR
jgi:hypothetical protein